MQPESSETWIRVGDVIGGHYRVDSTLGAGGHGVVFAATHIENGARVALKVLNIKSQESEVGLARFLREGETAARLRSEHIARLVETGTHADGTPFLATELLDGHDLAHLIGRRTKIATSDAVDYALQACRGLIDAHTAGIIHRDLKPANLFLAKSSAGRPIVKILDFGICKLADDREKLTRANEMVGTPLYMSPEQLRSARDVDERTDVWSLGVILYELLTQRVPFDGERFTTLMKAIFETVPTKAKRLRPDIPDELSAIIDRCLEKDPARRFRDVRSLADALAPYAVDDEEAVSTQGPVHSEVETQVRVVGRGPSTAKAGAKADAPVSSSPVTPPTLLSGETPVPVPPPKPAGGSNRRAARVTEEMTDLGRYVMCGPLASGGMASVYFGARKDDDGSLSTVAMKRLRSDITDPQYETMLRDEARITARVQHPNVVSTLDIVAHEGELIIVLEYVLGVSLSEAARAGRGPLPERSAMQIAIDVLHGLQAAHEATDMLGQPLEIVHRDISPQNILLDENGRARVVDFGIASARGRLQRTTEAGAVKGKLGYLAPEQLHGETSPAIDIYACGAVLWGMLTGQPLFTGSDPEVLAATLLGRIAPPSSIVPTISPALDAIVLKALARMPGDRFRSAAEMAAALTALGPATASETAAWLDSVAGPELAARRATAAEMLRRVAARDAAPPVPRVVVRPPEPSAPPPAPQRRSALPLVVAGGFGLAAAIVVVVFMLPSTKTPPAQPEPPPTASAVVNDVPPPSDSTEPVPSAGPEVVGAPAPKVPAKKRPAPKATPDCKVPYTVDAEGRTIWRRECFKQ